MSDGDLSRVEAKLDILIAIQRAAHTEALETLADSLHADPVANAILGAARDWTKAGDLKKRARSQVSASQATVSRRIADLVARGVILRRGSGPDVEYRASGLVND